MDNRFCKMEVETKNDIRENRRLLRKLEKILEYIKEEIEKKTKKLNEINPHKDKNEFITEARIKMVSTSIYMFKVSEERIEECIKLVKNVIDKEKI